MSVKLPKLPKGWSWDEMYPIGFTRNKLVTVNVTASAFYVGRESITEHVSFNIETTSPEELNAKYQEAVDKVATAVEELLTSPVRKNINALAEIHSQFKPPAVQLF